MEVGSLQAREFILERLLADDAMKRVIVEELVADGAWDRDVAWAEVRALDAELAKERREYAAEGEGIPQSEISFAVIEGLGKLLDGGLR